MDNTKLKEVYVIFESWLERHSHRDRVFLLLAGFVVIFLLWYLFFEKPLFEKIDQSRKNIASNNHELQVFQTQITHLKANAKFLSLQKKNDALKNNVTTKVPLASQKDNDIIIQTILTPVDNVHFLRLDNTTPTPTKSQPTVKNDVQLAFNSDYFATINYLAQLEKLPWCLSWDSLEYKVVNYPNADVVINLHIVNS